MTATVTPPRKKAKRTRKGRARQEAPSGFWRGETKDVEPFLAGRSKDASVGLDSNRFRLWMVQSGKNRVAVTGYVESLTWTEPEGNPITQASLTWRDAMFVRDTVAPRSGDLLILEFSPKPGAAFKEIWRMRVYDPSRTASTGQRTLTLANELNLMAASSDDFIFNKTTKPNGWTTKQIIEHVCARYGLPHVVVGGTARVLKHPAWFSQSPLDVIQWAIRHERKVNGRKLFGRMVGKTYVVKPLRRSAELWLMGPALTEALLSEAFASDAEDHFATALTVRAGHVKQTKKQVLAQNRHQSRSDKFAVQISTSEGVKRWGYVHRNVWAHGAASAAEARKLGLRHLARVAKPVRSLTLTHPGVPTLRKGDAVKVKIKDFGIHDLVWVTQVAHTLDASNYTMEVTVRFDNPNLNKKPDRVDENQTKTPVVKKKKKSKKNENRKEKKVGQPPKENAGDRLTRRAQRR